MSQPENQPDTLPTSPPPKTEAEKQVEIIENLERLVFRASFIPAEFTAAVDMIKFLQSLKEQATKAVPASAPPAPEGSGAPPAP